MSVVERNDGTVGKALAVLDRIASYGRPVRFGEVLATSDMPKATLYRFVQTLTNQGMLQYDPERQTYTPGLRLCGWPMRPGRNLLWLRWRGPISTR